MDDARQQPRLDLLIGILLLGSLWAFTEVVGNQAIRAAGLPFRSIILVAVGMGWLGVAAGRYRTWWPLLAVLGVTVALNRLVVAGLALPMTCQANSLLAVGIEGSLLATGFGLFSVTAQRSRLGRAAVGLGALFAAGVLFWTVGRHVAPCAYLLNQTLVAFMMKDGAWWGVTAAITVPLGHAVGTWSRSWTLGPIKRPAFAYAMSSALMLACWVSIWMVAATNW